MLKQRFSFYIIFYLLLVPGITGAQQIKAGSINGSYPNEKKLSNAIDTELIQGRILLTEATLDLNRALVQGIKASLDTFNLTSKAVINEKNMQATVHSMQRQRDKVLLTPYLKHMQDSLTTEILFEEQEKAMLEALLYGNALNNISPVIDTAGKITTTGNVSDTAIRYQTASNQLAKADTRPKHNKKTGKQSDGQAARTATNSSPLTPHPASISFDSLHIRPVIEANSSNQDGGSGNTPVAHWETARAIYENEDTATDEHLVHETVDTQTRQNSLDSAGYSPSVGVGTQSPISDSLRHIKAQLYWIRAMKANNEKNLKTASEDLKKALDLLPTYYDAWFSLGEIDARLGYYSKALNEFKTCAGIDNSKATLYSKMGNIYLKLGQKESAEVNFNKALSLDSNFILAIVGRASIYTDRKQYKTAIAEYNKVLKIDRGYHTAYRSKAMAEYHLKRYDDAIDDFTRFLIFDESDASAYYFRGMCKTDLHQQTEACIDLVFAAKLGYGPALKAVEAHCK